MAAPSKVLWGALFLEKLLVDLVLHRTGTFGSMSLGEALSRHQTDECYVVPLHHGEPLLSPLQAQPVQSWEGKQVPAPSSILSNITAVGDGMDLPSQVSVIPPC